MSSDHDDVRLKEGVVKCKDMVGLMAKQFLENQLDFDTEFKEEDKVVFKEALTQFIEFGNNTKLEQETIKKIEIQNQALTEESLNIDLAELLNISNIENLFDETFNELKRTTSVGINQVPEFKKLLNLLEDQQGGPNQGDDIEMLETDFEIPIDPISKREINIPVRNTVCNHLYDKEQLEKLFQTARARIIKCPVTGCANKTVSMKDVQEDSRMKIFIDRAREEQDN